MNIIAIPDNEARENIFAIQVPWLMGLIATRSFDTPVPGIHDLVERAKLRIGQGMTAYGALQKLRRDPDNDLARQDLAANDRFLGYGYLLKQFTDDVVNASPAEIEQAAWSTVPNVLVLFWAFRFMVGAGLYMILLFALAFYLCCKRWHDRYRWFLLLACFSLPAPWIAAEFGWIVAEYGRQPWVVEGILPTFMGVSSVTATQVWSSLIGFVVFYSALAIVDVFLMIRYVRMGPDGYLRGEPAADARRT